MLGWLNVLLFNIEHGPKSLAQTRVIYSREVLAQDLISTGVLPVSNRITDVSGRPQKERKLRLLSQKAEPVHFVGHCHHGCSVAGFKRDGKAQEGYKPIPDLSTLQILRSRTRHIRTRQL